MDFSRSIFQILCTVRVHGEIDARVDWSTAFCCEKEGTPVLATTRHTFSKANLGPELEIYLRGEGENWSQTPIEVNVVVHPVADLCLIFAASGFGRELQPLAYGGTENLLVGAPLTVRGFPGSWKDRKPLPNLDVSSGRVKTATVAKEIGSHRMTTFQTDLSGSAGLSGAPIFDGNLVKGIYSRGFGTGVIAVDASQIDDL